MKKDIKKYLITWAVCLIVFGISIYIGGIQNGSFNENPSIIKTIAFFTLSASILIGVISFLLLMYRFVDFSVNKGEEKKKNIFKSILLFIITAPIFPLYTLIMVVKSYFSKRPKVKDIRWLVLGATIFIITPVWFLGYIVAYNVGSDVLGIRYQIATLDSGDSMAPSFPANSIHKYYIYKNIFYKINKDNAYKFQRGDTVAFTNEITQGAIAKAGLENYFFFKRIIALPGDTVEMKSGAVFINDKPIEEPYILEPNSTFVMEGKYESAKQWGVKGLYLQNCQKITVPEHKLFVLGDNRNHSDDSRIIGFVDFDDVVQYLPLAEQKVTYYEGINPINHSEKWRDASKDYENLIKLGKELCPKN